MVEKNVLKSLKHPNIHSHASSGKENTHDVLSAGSLGLDLRRLIFPKFSLMDQFKGVDILNPQIMLGHAVWSFRITLAARGGEFLMVSDD